jgi:acid phosphatase (class A)
MCGNSIAIVLADLLPERRAAIFARGWVFAKQRPLGGVHYPSDIEAGRICAAAVVARLWQEPAFRADLEAARTELRKVFPAPVK